MGKSDIFPGLSISKIRILKGPDRLLRLRVIIEDVFDMKASVEILVEIINGILIKNHGVTTSLSYKDLHKKLEVVDDTVKSKYCQIGNEGRIALDFFFRRYGPIEISIDYYNSVLEYIRKCRDIELFNKMHGDLFEEQNNLSYTLLELRNGSSNDYLELGGKIVDHK